MSKQIGVLIDKLYAFRSQRIAKQHEVDELKKEETRLDLQLQELLQNLGLNKATGKQATFSAKKIEVPNIVDWDAFYKFIHDHNYYHLLQKRVSSPAVMEAFSIHGKIDGVETVTITKTSLTKASK